MSQPEKNAAEVDGTRRAIFIAVALISALLIAGVVYFATRPSTQTAEPRLEGAIRPGTPEFDAIRERVVVDFTPDDSDQGTRALGDVMITMRPKIRNLSGRTISAIELRGEGLDLSDVVVKGRTVVRQVEIEPNKTLTVPMVLEGIKPDAVPAKLQVKLTGIKFK